MDMFALVLKSNIAMKDEGSKVVVPFFGTNSFLSRAIEAMSSLWG